MKEIGSEFWTGCTTLDGKGIDDLLPFGFDAKLTLSGRTALELILSDMEKVQKIQKAYLPSYCCHTMILPFKAHNIEVVFFDVSFYEDGIDIGFEPENDCDVIYLLDYFGFASKKTLQITTDQRAKGKTVIYDSTHSLFSEGIDYSMFDYVIGSFRKWLGVNAGFCAKKTNWYDFPILHRNDWYTSTRNEAFDNKQKYMYGVSIEKSTFLDAFSKAEADLEKNYINYEPDERTKIILETVNIDLISELRRKNSTSLIDGINKLGSNVVFSPYNMVNEDECPLFVPLYVHSSLRDLLRLYLIKQQIYLPVHWPISELHCLNEKTIPIYDSELSCVCDQRYTLDDMNRIIAAVRSFLDQC